MTNPCICTAVRKASRKLTARYDTALEPLGISLAQFSLLRSIAEHGPVSLGRLAPIVALDRSTLGRNMRVLERLGLASIMPGDDLREASLSLTEPGRRTLDQAVPVWEGAQDEIRRRLGVAGTAQLEALLGVLQD